MQQQGTQRPAAAYAGQDADADADVDPHAHGPYLRPSTLADVFGKADSGRNPGLRPHVECLAREGYTPQLVASLSIGELERVLGPAATLRQCAEIRLAVTVGAGRPCQRRPPWRPPAHATTGQPRAKATPTRRCCAGVA